MPGDHVIYVDEWRRRHNALLTCVHGEAAAEYQPSVNLLYVTEDNAKVDPYGNQTERRSSVPHRGDQRADGNYWDLPD